MNIADWLVASATQNPQKTALICGNESISYEQLDRSTTALANWLLSQSCSPGDRVALHWPNSIEMVKLLFACFKAGLIAVPVNIHMKAPEVAYVLAHSKAALCFAHPDFAVTTRQTAKGNVSLRAIHTSLDGLDTGVGKAVLSQVNIDDPALILYTSGTTARPKGVTLSHRTLMEGVRLLWSGAPPQLQTVLVMTQMAFISSLIAGLLPAVLLGATTVLVRTFEAPLVLDLIERFQCGFVFALPSMVQFLIEEQVRQPRNISSLRTLIVAGDAVPVAVHQRFQSIFEFQLREAYGMTEIGPSIGNPLTGNRPGSLGKTIAEVEVRIVDSNGADLPDGQIGEIITKSPAIFIGYWDDPAATRASFQDGWFHTGDLGRRDGDGYYWFEGRKKEIIIRDGVNISPQEVEEAFYDHPAVLEAAVIGMPDPMPARGEQVVAFISLREGLAADREELKNHVRLRLSDFKVPERIILLENLPKGMTGKIQRRALKEIAAANDAAAGNLQPVAVSA
jgi:long-chain acyl-CoA synthetase